MDQKITESHLPGQYLDIALVPGQYPDIALAAGQYKIYCPALAFDLPTQSVTYIYIYIHYVTNSLCKIKLLQWYIYIFYDDIIFQRSQPVFILAYTPAWAGLVYIYSPGSR